MFLISIVPRPTRKSQLWSQCKIKAAIYISLEEAYGRGQFLVFLSVSSILKTMLSWYYKNSVCAVRPCKPGQGMRATASPFCHGVQVVVASFPQSLQSRRQVIHRPAQGLGEGEGEGGGMSV